MKDTMERWEVADERKMFSRDDEEVWCEMNALNERGCYDKDWANPGKQSHNPY